MKYIITAAGRGTRLLKSGIKPPKPLVIVEGIELLIWSLNSFTFNFGDELFIVSLKKDNVKKCLLNKLEILYPQVIFNWLELENITGGQLNTALIAIRDFSIKGPIIIHNCDTSYTSLEKGYEQMDSSIFGAIPYFHAEGENWSFIKTNNEQNTITKVKEKKRISSKCSVGTYFFRDAEELLEISKNYIKSINKNSISEYYISPVYDFAINSGFIVKAIKVNNVKTYGTLEEICTSFNKKKKEIICENDFSAHQRKTLVFDIDGTICKSPYNNDYSSCEPFESVCSKLREENEKGTYIILYTSRNMRTFKGNVGLINKYTAPLILEWLQKYDIPFDEIYFNKPWGYGELNYIDDKFISIKDLEL